METFVVLLCVCVSEWAANQIGKNVIIGEEKETPIKAQCYTHGCENNKESERVNAYSRRRWKDCTIATSGKHRHSGRNEAN